FLKAAGFEIGQSLCENDMLDIARRLLARDADIPVPTDVVCGKAFSADTPATIKQVGDIEPDDLIMDLGPDSVTRICEMLQGAGTVVWNGPLGVFEFPAFAAGTRRMAESIADSQAFSIAGGGDTLAAIGEFGVADRLSYISTAGGAFLEFLEGKTLPAIAMLEARAGA
ncbi:MAG: phosphoglycerate kinase, partial [Alphaproteobacteria bacterium]